jgi:uncharacterized membrane protein YesL
MFEKIREVKTLLHLVEAYVPKYGPLLREDVRQFRNEVVKATVGGAIIAAAGLIFSCFLSLAVIISAWSGDHRIAVAWGVCAVWGVFAIVGLILLLVAFSGPLPFLLISRQAQTDYANLLVVLKQDMDSHS